jgi:hypothetical protein
LIGFSFPTADQITLEFRPQTVPGFYLAIIGPQIFDLEGFPMDQNGDGQAGGFGDSYTAFFEVTERQSTITGDFNDDQIVDAIDVDLICSALNASNHGTAFDLNSDGIVDVSDMDEMIFNVVGTIYGDINLDRVVDTTDFNIWNANKFQSGTHWSSGDLTCDSFTDVSDFNVWSSRKFQSAVPALTPVETPQRATNDALIGVSPATPVPSKTMSNRLRSTDRIWSIFGA